MKWPKHLIEEQIGLSAAVRLIPSTSMRPTLGPGDFIRFQRSTSQPKFGELWVALERDRYLIHRVVAIHSHHVLFKGDSNLGPDGWFPRSALFGPVLEIQHNGKWRPANRLRDRVLGLALSGVGTTYQASRLVARRVAITVLGEPRARALKKTLFGR